VTRRQIGNLTLYEFPSFEEYLQRAADPALKLPATQYGHHSRRPESRFGTTEFEAALRHARLGWNDVTEDITKWAGMVVQDISTRLPRPEIQFDKTGEFWDLGRVMEDDPECWYVEVPTQDIERSGKGNIVRLVINTASSYTVRSVAHRNRCGAIMALTQLLEESGFYTQIEITTAIEVWQRKVEFRTVAKNASEVLNVGALSFWCSALQEKYIDFSICETLPECLENGVLGYGAPLYTVDHGDVCFDRLSTAPVDMVDWANEASVRRYIYRALKRQGVILK
jgi:hypothetical protein